uniref:Cytoplasmic tRNA 2-thiolation protein 2 n=1 Tax=Trichuris muris TaxID=70415 RepID=A0A5S6QFY4_TRIMR
MTKKGPQRPLDVQPPEVSPSQVPAFLPVPAYTPSDPELWFARLHLFFQLLRIHDEAAMFELALSSMPEDALTQLRDFVLTAHLETTPFSTLKRLCLNRVTNSLDQGWGTSGPRDHSIRPGRPLHPARQTIPSSPRMVLYASKRPAAAKRFPTPGLDQRFRQALTSEELGGRASSELLHWPIDGQSSSCVIQEWADVKVYSVRMDCFSCNEVILPRNKRCVKCRSSASVAFQRRDSHCVTCFREIFSHKFRSALGREKLFRSESQVLVEVDGSAGSVSLVNLVLEAADHKEPRRLRMSPSFIHILLSMEEIDPDSLAALSNHLDRTGCPCYVVDIAAIFADDVKEHVTPFSGEIRKCSYAHKMQDLCNSCACDTVKQELICRLKLALLYRVARSLQLGFVLLDFTSTILSAAVISSVAQGRGQQIVDEVAVVDRRWMDVSFLRPLRDISNKEAALYNYYFQNRQVAFAIYPQRLLAAQGQSSVQSASYEFIEREQMDFPATVSTLLASASKFQKPNTNLANSIANCSLCSSGTDIELLKEINTTQGRFCQGCASLIELVGAKSLMALVIATMTKERNSSQNSAF